MNTACESLGKVRMRYSADGNPPVDRAMGIIPRIRRWLSEVAVQSEYKGHVTINSFIENRYLVDILMHASLTLPAIDSTLFSHDIGWGNLNPQA